MSAAENWLVVAPVLAAASAVLHLMVPPIHPRIPNALHPAALACAAIALVIVLP
jgi:hypothetical protein